MSYFRSQTLSRWFLYLGLVVSLFAIVFLLHARLNPAVHPVGTDSGVFLYTGQRILAGDVLYRDVWDHKPPGIHFVNELALRLIGDTPWAMWWMEVAWVTLSAVILLVSITRVRGLRLASGAAIVYVCTMHLPHLLRDFNFTETFAQLPQFLSALFFLLHLESRKLRWVVMLGFSVSLTFLFRQTDIGMGCIFFMLILTSIPTWKLRRMVFIAFVAGGLIIPFAAVIYWSSQAALVDLWTGVIGYNLDYASTANIFTSVLEAIEHLSTSYPLLMLFSLAVGLLFCHLGLLWQRVRAKDGIGEGEAALESPSTTGSVRLLEIAICLALPLNLLLVNLSGRNYGHYYQSILPTLVIGSVLLVARIRDLVIPAISARSIDLSLAGILAALFLGWGIQLGPLITPDFNLLQSMLNPDTYHRVEEGAVIEFIRSNTDADDRVMVWGSEVSINFLSHRQSPSRYSSSLYVTLPGNGTLDRFEEYLASVTSEPPELIIFKYPPDRSTPADFEADVLCADCTGSVMRYFQILRGFVREHYSYDGSFGEWQVLRLQQ